MEKYNSKHGDCQTGFWDWQFHRSWDLGTQSKNPSMIVGDTWDLPLNQSNANQKVKRRAIASTKGDKDNMDQTHSWNCSEQS